MLLEVVLASVLVLLALVPAARLLATSEKAVSNDRAKVVAANLASGQLEQDRAVVDGATWSPSPDLPTPVSPVDVRGEPFTLTQGAGWCAETTGGGVTTWGNYTSAPANPAAFAVLVTVTWVDASQSVSAGETFTTPQSDLADVPSASSGCPL